MSVTDCGSTMLPDATIEALVALSAAVARYQMAIEAISVCEYSSDQGRIAKAALEEARA